MAASRIIRAGGGVDPSSVGESLVSNLSIGDYLIKRLQDYGVRDIFGVPGDYVLSFYSQLEESPLNVVGCTREDCAGFAADAYARINGMGAVCITYCVGGLSLCNSIAGAYAEKSPVLVISGSPGLSERHNNPLLHHKVRNFRTQSSVFQQLCTAHAELADPALAFQEIDRVLASMARYHRPGYIEIPRDVVGIVPEGSHRPQVRIPKSDSEVLAEAVQETAKLIAASRNPVIVAGVEIHRFGLQKQLLDLAERTQIPITTTMLGKSVVSETHPLFAGLYEGAMGRTEVTQLVEESDCVILLGAFMTDVNLGIYTANLDPAKCIAATSESLQISRHHYHDVLLSDFLEGVTAAVSQSETKSISTRCKRYEDKYELNPDAPITIQRLISRLNQSLDDSTVVIADIGDALFASSELIIRKQTEFISPAYYTSMGFAVPAALGSLVGRPDLSVIAIVGDGAFQMTGMELSTIVRRGYAPVVIVLNNGGYGTERLLHKGEHAYNEIHSWRYHKLPEVLGGGKGYDVRTEGEFDKAIQTAIEDESGMSLIEVHLDPNDSSQTLNRLADRLSKRV